MIRRILSASDGVQTDPYTPSTLIIDNHQDRAQHLLFMLTYSTLASVMLSVSVSLTQRMGEAGAI